MTYWWVNHKQTHRAEINGGYVWSPKAKVNGRPNETYTNLTRVAAGDVVLSYADGLIKAIGIATAPCQDALKPAEFGMAGAAWSNLGWLVPIEWQLLHEPLSPKAHLDRIAPLLPTKHSPIRAETGNGNQACYLAEISNELGTVLQELFAVSNAGALAAAAETAAEAVDDSVQAQIEAAGNANVTEVDQVVRARRGQGRFRLSVLDVEKCCRLTGVALEPFLIASHIKPWSVCSDAERLDGHNGLLLAPHVDRLFDRGWISFADDGSVLVSGPEASTVLAAWKLLPAIDAQPFTDRQRMYLAYHREHVFGKAYALSTEAG